MDLEMELFWSMPYVTHHLSIAAKKSSNYGGGSGVWHSGGNTGAFRRICVTSVAVAEPSAAQKCQFGGLSRASRLSIQRKYCNLCNNCNI